MNAAAKLAAYGLVLAGMVGGGAGIGAAVGPIDTGDGGDEHRAGHSESTPAPEEVTTGGPLVSQDGYTFVPASRTIEAGRTNRFSFAITGPDGESLGDYERLDDRELHLIVVSDDLAEFHHVHPTRDEEGTWSVDLPALQPGAHRAYADFQPRDGGQLALGIDLTAAGGTVTPSTPGGH